jgi:hypothetical protein
MDVGALASSLIGAQVGQLQLAVAAKMLRMDFDAEKSVAKLIDAANSNVDRLANVAAGVGENLDISI